MKTLLSADFNVSAYELISGEISYVTSNASLAKENKCKMANLDSATKIAHESIICTAGTVISLKQKTTRNESFW